MGSSLHQLYAEYVRGDEAVVEVLHDALLERGERPFPAEGDASVRIERVMACLPTAMQRAIGCASVRRVLGDHGRAFPDVAQALALLERGEPNDESRHAVFAAWRACSDGVKPEAARVIWAVWMLLREMPSIALRTVRMLDDRELAIQIELVAGALDG